MKRKLTLINVLLLVSLAALAESAPPFPAPLRDSNITLSGMTNGKLEGLVIGNGDLYGVVWDREGELVLRMTKNDVWDARVDTSKDGPMPKVDIAAGTVTGQRGDTPSWKDHLYPQPRCAVALRLGPVPQPFRGHLDLAKAVVAMGAGDAPRTFLRVLYDRNVLLVKSRHPVELEEIKSETLPPAETGMTDGVSWLRMKMPGDMDYKGMEYAVAVASKGDLKAASLVTSFDVDGGDVLEHAIKLAEKTAAESEETLVARHEHAWSNYWARSGVQLEDKVLERWWYRMLYFAGTTCRPGAAPVGIMPPLAIDMTPWHADFHHNYNTWQCFWPLPGFNHPELVDPWISYNDGMIPRYKNLARETYGIDGIHLPISSFLHEPDPAVCKSVNKRQVSLLPWGLTIGLQGMTLQSMWCKFQCDQDAGYMKEKIYPYLREAARFYVNFMGQCRKDEDGKILLGPSYSPEHGDPGIFNCPFDIAYVHYTFDAMIEAGTLLKSDAELVESCRTFKRLLPPYPTAPDKDGKPIVVDWVGCKVGEVKKHNVTVPASPVFPGEQVTWFDDEAVKELYRRTINQINFRDANAHVMINIARARLSMPEAHPKAKAWFESRERPNGLFEWVGHGHAVYMPEMIGIAGLINEFLLQSVGNKIRLFPCWPKDQDAKFTRLLAQGGFLVSAEWKNGKVASAEIESTAGRQLQLLSPWKSISVNGKKVGIDKDGLVTLDTKPGQVLRFAEAGVPTSVGDVIRNGTDWKDTDGNPVSCHEGGMSRFGDMFYWYGTSYIGNPKGICGQRLQEQGLLRLRHGLNVYSSRDLANWKYEGVALDFNRPGNEIKGSGHRPSVIYNATTKQYVMWFFDFTKYPAPMMAVAVSDSPTGPFRIHARDVLTGEEHGYAQDCGLFQDDDGKAYLVYDDGHRNLRVDLLSDDYLSSTRKNVVALAASGVEDAAHPKPGLKAYEGAAMIKYKGKYIVAGSGVCGWGASPTTYAVASSPLGPYSEPRVMSEKDTWGSQISNFIHLRETDTVMALCDQWWAGQNPRSDLETSRYLWLPVAFDPKTGEARMEYAEQWNPLHQTPTKSKTKNR